MEGEWWEFWMDVDWCGGRVSRELCGNLWGGIRVFRDVNVWCEVGH